MSLTFDYSKCDQSVLTDEHYEQTVEFVVFQTMFVGMHEITEVNWSQFVMRVMFFQAATNTYGYSQAEVCEKVRPWIGLRTNASPMTDAAFFKSIRERSESTMRSMRMGYAKEKVA